MAKRKRRQMSEMNVVPYIDVMLVLLVIFMVTAPLLTQGVKVDLPQATTQVMPPQPALPVIATVDVSGQFHLKLGAEAEINQIEPQLLGQKVADYVAVHPQVNVAVKGDRDVRYQKVMDLMTLLQQAGVASVGLLSEQPDEQR